VFAQTKKRQAAANPLLQRRGGCAIKKSCEATFDAQTGWSKTFLTTPSAPVKGSLRRYLLEVASTPPLEEGTSSSLAFSSFGQHARKTVLLDSFPLHRGQGDFRLITLTSDLTTIDSCATSITHGSLGRLALLQENFCSAIDTQRLLL